MFPAYLDQRCQICNVPLLPISLYPPESNVIVSSSGGQSTLAMGLKVSGIDRGIIVMPGDEEW